MWLHWQSSERILDYIWLHSKYESRKKIKHPIMLYAIPVDFGKFFRFFVFVLTNFSIKNKEFVTEYAFSKINICQYIPPSKLQNAKMNVNLIFGEDNVNSMMKTRTCKGSALTYFLTNSLTTQPIVTSIN
jgi:hypothetical protein